MAAMSDPRSSLDALFEADRALRHAERRFLESAPSPKLASLLADATQRALAMEEGEEQELALLRLADLCAQVEGPIAVDTLLQILDHANPSVRTEAGEALLDVAYERFKEVALAIERALTAKKDGLAMEELPYVLIEVHDPDPMPLVLRFLDHPRAEVVASAIEAIVERADPTAIDALERLVEDEREVTVPELDDEKVTIGDLAADALAFFEDAFGDEEEEAPRGKPASAPKGKPAPAKPAPKPAPSKPGGDRGGRRR